MKNIKKLNLSDLKVESFITSIELKKINTLKGGITGALVEGQMGNIPKLNSPEAFLYSLIYIVDKHDTMNMGQIEDETGASGGTNPINDGTGECDPNGDLPYSYNVADIGCC